MVVLRAVQILDDEFQVHVLSLSPYICIKEYFPCLSHIITNFV